MKSIYLALAASVACVASSAQAASTTYNSTPADGWFYGNGNNYTPANTAVLTTDGGDQLYLRGHQTFVAAPASTFGTYNFALGTTPISFDWGLDNNQAANITALLTITNLGTGGSVAYNPFFAGNDNATGSGSSQNSARLTFASFAPVGFTPNMDSIYRVTLDVTGLAGGPQSLSVDAQLGAGAVPEPATWAMMIGGFGMIGGTVRSRRGISVSFA